MRKVYRLFSLTLSLTRSGGGRPQDFERAPWRFACNQMTSLVNGVPGSGGGCGAGIEFQTVEGGKRVRHGGAFASYRGACAHTSDGREALALAKKRIEKLFAVRRLGGTQHPTRVPPPPP